MTFDMAYVKLSSYDMVLLPYCVKHSYSCSQPQTVQYWNWVLK